MNMASDRTALELARIAAGQRTLIRLALEKTHEMLGQARSGNWDDISGLEKERKLLLEQCFYSAIVPENAEIFSEALAIMLHMNEELVSLINNAKSAASLTYGERQRNHEAVGHYLDVVSESEFSG
jgi:hypothetical protein